MERLFMVTAGILGFVGVALGAFGAHGLSRRLADVPDFAQRMQWWQTAAHYHLVHALALGLSSYLVARGGSTSANVSGFAFVLGVLLFSGSLYVMTLTGIRALGAVTPVGGLCMLVGWGALTIAAARMS